jgi:hypothetical protein
MRLGGLGGNSCSECGKTVGGSRWGRTVCGPCASTGRTDNPALLVLGNPGQDYWVQKAIIEGVTDIGQIPLESRRALKRAVQKGTIAELQDLNFPIPKKHYAGVRPPWGPNIVQKGRSLNPAAPARIKKSWERFHMRPFTGKVRELPDIPGAPTDLVELGAFVDMKTSKGTWTGDHDDMVCYEPKDKSIWIIGPRHLGSSPYDGAVVRTVAYRTYGKSGKDHSVYEHKFHEPHPVLATVHALAALLDGGKYVVTDWIRK